jgi:hypothetical protein
MTSFKKKLKRIKEFLVGFSELIGLRVNAIFLLDHTESILPQFVSNPKK